MRYLALLALLASGCYASGPYHVDKRFSPEERAAIQQAADAWNTPIDLVWDADVSAFDSGTRREIIRVDTQVLGMVDSTAEENDATAYTAASRIFINPSNTKHVPLWYVVAHELGHSMGLDHVEDPSALMHAKNTAETRWCVTEADSEEFARVNGYRVRPGCK